MTIESQLSHLTFFCITGPECLLQMLLGPWAAFTIPYEMTNPVKYSVIKNREQENKLQTLTLRDPTPSSGLDGHQRECGTHTYTSTHTYHKNK